jgi:hypothetical protein
MRWIILASSRQRLRFCGPMLFASALGLGALKLHSLRDDRPRQTDVFPQPANNVTGSPGASVCRPRISATSSLASLRRTGVYEASPSRSTNSRTSVVAKIPRSSRKVRWPHADGEALAGAERSGRPHKSRDRAASDPRLALRFRPLPEKSHGLRAEEASDIQIGGRMIEVALCTYLLDMAVAHHQGRRASSRGSRAKPSGSPPGCGWEPLTHIRPSR